jgi:ABC-type cobalamin/Fe3+-siderophores transport system ATPase subunit
MGALWWSRPSFANLTAINRDGLTILLVEQNVLHALRLSHRAYVLENGTITLAGPSATLLAGERVRRAYRWPRSNACASWRTCVTSPPV